MRWNRARHSRFATAVPDAVAAERRLLRMVDGAFQRARDLAGEWLVCAPGCSECCVGPFPITRLDARRLRRGLAELAGRDPERAAAIRRRAAQARERLREGFPGDGERGILAGDEAAEDRFAELHADVPCPVLDTAAGTCELYDHRPVACRTYGPPVRFGSEVAPPCRLCFDGASRQQVDRCRVDPDPADLEGRLLRSTEGARADEETFIAFAL